VLRAPRLLKAARSSCWSNELAKRRGCLPRPG
jgi:hypothetical protein